MGTIGWQKKVYVTRRTYAYIEIADTGNRRRREAPGRYRSFATRLISTAARAFETGHSVLAA
jgi:hypothetical protein